jgi:sodium/proline symporter
VVPSFLFFLAVFLIIGVSSYFYSLHTRHDYYLASQTMPPWLVGLSAVATNNSGYMFIGIIGFTYTSGLSSIWLMIGWITGDFLASLFVHPRLREATSQCDETSYAGVISHWGGTRFKVLQRLAAVVSIIFLLAYSSAQMVAGGKALQVLFGWPGWGGAVLVAMIVLAYCLAGGIRASIWTDAAQSFVMIIAMGLLLVAGIMSFGGIGQVLNEMNRIEGYLNWFPRDSIIPGTMGMALFVTGWMFAGVSVIGQPHIMVRFMTLKDPGKMLNARIWYYSWYILFYSMTCGVGLLSRVYLGDTWDFDAELALPTMAVQLLSPPLVGLILAGMFAATMSTADSLVLSCSASLTHDLIPHRIEKNWILKLATTIMTVLALIWALVNSQSVFSLVIMAWSALASAFAPILLVLAWGGRLPQPVAITMMSAGIMTVFLWRLADLHVFIYEGMPGILVGLLVYFVFNTSVESSKEIRLESADS